MKKIKNIYKLICICILIVIICSFQNSNITNISKASNNGLNKNLNLNAMAKVMETFAMNDLNTPLDTYFGTLTAYVANCPECSGKLGCTGQNVSNGITTYQDSDYGTVNILASSANLPCGSIVRFKNDTLSSTGYVTAIVLDRGVTGTTIDILVDSVGTAKTKVGSKKINYDILRFGWTRQRV